MEQNQNEPGIVRPWLLIILAVVVITGIGFFVWNMQQNKKTVEPTSAPITTPTNSAVSTADWKTYTDSTNSFSFKYPSNIFVKSVGSDGNVGGNDFQLCLDNNPSTADSILFCQDASGMSISIANNLKNLSLDAFVKEKQSEQEGQTTYKNEPISIAGQAGIKSMQTSVCDGVGCDYGTYYLKNDSIIAIIRYNPSDKADVAIFDQILSTFQFTK